MRTLYYDGTFTGFLNVIEYVLGKNLFGRVRVVNTRLAARENDLFGEDLWSQPARAKTFLRFLGRTLPREVFRKLYLYYLCDSASLEVPLAEVLKKSLENRNFWPNITDENVTKLYRAERAFHRERHRYLGLLRFVELPSQILFARFEPRYNVLPELRAHFTRRFPNERFLIFDSRRRLLFLYAGNRGELLWVEEVHLPSSPPSDPFAALWKAYLAEIAIPERESEKRQLRKLPLRVRRFLTEFL